LRAQRVWRKLIFWSAVAVAIWLPRGLALDRFVTVDEPSWLTFSANFYQALHAGELKHTFQIAHPGVTTTWAGSAAFAWSYPDYPHEIPGQVDYAQQEVGRVLRAHGQDPVRVLATGRAIVVAAITLVLMLAAVAAARLLGLTSAVLGFLLIAGDPFHIALSRLLHVDALASSLMFLSLLSFLSYLHAGGRRADLIVSAVSAGLAWLTKAPALFLMPFLTLLIVLELWPRWRGNRRLGAADARRAVGPLVAWGAIALLVFVLAWPAMWVDPVGSLRAIAREAMGMARFGHVEAPLFFNGVIVHGDPGWDFYPITYLWRTTPVVLVGLVLAGLGFASRWSGFTEPSQRRLAAVLVLFVVLFTLVMSAGAKKFDRYLLPIYPPLDLLAAMGWIACARRLMHGSSQLLARAAPALLSVAAIGQFAVALPQFPYYLSYYNPVLGGTANASRVMMVGWGEGLDQAARYLNSQPGADRLRVATWFWDGTFSYFFKGQILPGRPPSDSTGIRQWLNADYCVLYINQRQRGRLPRELLEYVDGLQPAMVVRIHGLEYAQVYDLRSATFPAGHLRGKIGSTGS
jgi:4-amino-4-deoxy-L-arabinose transferase-like glycosyltransferase